MYTSAMIETLILIMTMKKKQPFLQHKNTKEAYTDGSKNMGKKVGFATVFIDITRRGSLTEEASLHTTEMTAIKVALKEIHRSEDKKWVIYKDSQRSMQSIEYSKEN